MRCRRIARGPRETYGTKEIGRDTHASGVSGGHVLCSGASSHCERRSRRSSRTAAVRFARAHRPARGRQGAGDDAGALPCPAATDVVDVGTLAAELDLASAICGVVSDTAAAGTPPTGTAQAPPSALPTVRRDPSRTRRHSSGRRVQRGAAAVSASLFVKLGELRNPHRCAIREVRGQFELAPHSADVTPQRRDVHVDTPLNL